MHRKISILLLLLLLLLVACSNNTSDNETFTFSGETDNWAANLKINQTDDDYEKQEFVLKYKGKDANSVGEIKYNVDTGFGGFSRSGATLEENGTLKDNDEANPTNAKVNKNSEIEVTVKWNGNTETFKLSV